MVEHSQLDQAFDNENYVVGLLLLRSNFRAFVENPLLHVMLDLIQKRELVVFGLFQVIDHSQQADLELLPRIPILETSFLHLSNDLREVVAQFHQSRFVNLGQGAVIRSLHGGRADTSVEEGELSEVVAGGSSPGSAAYSGQRQRLGSDLWQS